MQSIEDHVVRQKQILREATARLQNLQFHLRLVGEEGSQVPYEDQGIPHSQAKDDLERFLCPHVYIKQTVGVCTRMHANQNKSDFKNVWC